MVASTGQFRYTYQEAGLEEAFAAFFDRASFVSWLGFQNDESLSGRESGDPWYIDHQRITRAPEGGDRETAPPDLGQLMRLRSSLRRRHRRGTRSR
jgi:hypothetical protein